MTALSPAAMSAPRFGSPAADTTFEPHYSIGDLARTWRVGRETVRLLIKDEPGIVKIRLGLRKSMTRYSVPESVARRVHSEAIQSAMRSRQAYNALRGMLATLPEGFPSNASCRMVVSRACRSGTQRA